MRYDLFTLFFLFAASVFADTGKRQIKITDLNSQPLFGVYILKIPENYLLNSTNEEGETEIDMTHYKPNDKLVLYSMGFITDTITVSRLKNPKTSFTLREKVNLLPEVTISQRPFSLLEIVQKVTANIQKTRIKGSQWEPRYYGQSSYTKITSCKNQPVQVRQESGIFITSGNVRHEKGPFDIAYHLYFMPEYVARSFDFDCSGRDTLKRTYVNLSTPERRHLNYNVSALSKIYNAMRVVYLFTPPFSNPKYFNYQLVEETDDQYILAFSTLPQYYPQKIRVLSKGTLAINKNNLQLENLSIEHLDDARFQFKINKTSSQPFQKKMKIDFAYNAEQICYIKNCHLETQWLYDYSPTVSIREGCNRPNAAKNQLIEQENWHCENYLAFPDINIQLKDKDLEYILRFIHLSQEGTYLPDYFEKCITSPEYQKAEACLNQFLDIHQQYLQNSNKPYIEWSETTFSPSEWPEIKKFKTFLIQQLKNKISL